MGTFFASYPSLTAAANPSVGPNGQPIPGDGTLIAGENNSGNLQPLQTDSSGNLLVSLAAEPLSPLIVKDVADGSVTGGTAGTFSQLAGGQYNTSFPSLTTGQQSALQIDSSGRLLVSQPTASALNATVVQGTASNLLAQVSQPTASALNATVVQGTAANLLSQVSQPTASALNATVVQGTAANLLAQVSQPTASALNATVVGLGSAGTPSGGVLSIQGISGGTNVNVSLAASSATVTVSGTVTANQGSANATPWNQNTAQIGGSSVSTAATGVQKVGIVGNTGTALDSAAGTPNAQAITIQGNSSGVAVPVSGTISNTTKGTATANAPVYNVYSSTNITTGAYVQLVASTSNAINTIHIFDSSGQAMILGVGGSGSEVVQAYIAPGGDLYTLNIPAGSRIAYKALTNNATTGYLLMSFLG